eukprot:scaffold713_cov131-Cylindrotheca_fusiformis.AAC.36
MSMPVYQEEFSIRVHLEVSEDDDNALFSTCSSNSLLFIRLSLRAADTTSRELLLLDETSDASALDLLLPDELDSSPEDICHLKATVKPSSIGLLLDCLEDSVLIGLGCCMLNVVVFSNVLCDEVRNKEEQTRIRKNASLIHVKRRNTVPTRSCQVVGNRMEAKWSD